MSLNQNEMSGNSLAELDLKHLHLLLLPVLFMLALTACSDEFSLWDTEVKSANNQDPADDDKSEESYALPGASGDSHPSASPTSADFATASIKYVVDGDTVVITIGGQSEKVRLIGIDAPESRSESRPIQCYGKEASDFLSSYLPPGTEIMVQRDVEARDRYGRLLLYVFKGDVFVNEHLVAMGFANAQAYGENTARQHQLNDALRQAQANSVGLWQNCDGPDQPLN